MLEMWRRDVPIGLGTDGAASLGPLDLFQVAHLARLGQQIIEGTPNHDRGVTSGEDMLAVAIRGGARAAGMTRELGSLAPGKRADIILVAADDPDQQPVYDPLFTAANNVVGRDVRTVIVDGRLVMKDRAFLTIDVEALQAKLRPQHRALMERFEAAIA
jgi:5-methylthioadenosine/S-adenosylhomocysteine deaminase